MKSTTNHNLTNVIAELFTNLYNRCVMREVVCTQASRTVLGYDSSFTMKLTTVLCETTAKLVTVTRKT